MTRWRRSCLRLLRPPPGSRPAAVAAAISESCSTKRCQAKARTGRARSVLDRRQARIDVHPPGPRGSGSPSGTRARHADSGSAAGTGPDLAEKPSLVNREAENIGQRIRSSEESPDRLSRPPVKAVQFPSKIYQTRFFCQISEVSTPKPGSTSPCGESFLHAMIRMIVIFRKTS